MYRVLRLVGGLLTVSVGVLTLAPAPQSLGWAVTIIATEFGYFLALPALFCLLPGWRQSIAGRLGVVLSIAGTVMLLLPVARAVQTSRPLPNLLDAQFGADHRLIAAFAEAPRPAPFAFPELVRPVQSKPVRYEKRVFKSLDGEELGVHVFHPAYQHGAIPGVVVIHGESWDNGRELVALDAYLAARDFVVATIVNRSGSVRRFPDSRDDLISTLAYLKVHAADFGLDPTRLALLGRSIGGHLAVLMAHTLNSPAIRGAISLYAPSDLHAWYDSAAGPHSFDSRAILNDYLGGPPDRQKSAYYEASPINFVRRGGPATLLVHGMRDEVVPPDQSERLAARLEEEGVRHLLVRLPWATHGCDRNFGGPCGQLTTYSVERFLNAVMAGPSVPAPRVNVAERRR